MRRLGRATRAAWRLAGCSSDSGPASANFFSRRGATHSRRASRSERGTPVVVNKWASLVRPVPARVPVLPGPGDEAQGRGRFHRRELERQPRRRRGLPEGGARPVQATSTTRSSRSRRRSTRSRPSRARRSTTRRASSRSCTRAGTPAKRAGGGHRPLRSLTVEVREARTEAEVAAALELRERVFCGEQGVSFEADQDGRDPEATHIVAVDDGRRDRHLPAAVPRPGGPARAAGGGAGPPRRRRRRRDPRARRTGSPRRRAPTSIALHAQTYALPLYATRRLRAATGRPSWRRESSTWPWRSALPELRIDPLTGLRVIVAGERGSRPGRVPRRAPRAADRPGGRPVRRRARGPDAAGGVRAARRDGELARARGAEPLPALCAGDGGDPGTDPLAGGRGEPDLFASRPATGAHEVV